MTTVLLEVCLLSQWSLAFSEKSARVSRLGEKVGQAWRLHVHPQDSAKAAYVNSSDVKWSLSEIEVPTMQNALEKTPLRFRKFVNLA